MTKKQEAYRAAEAEQELWDLYCEFMQDEIDTELNGSLELFEDYQLPPQSWHHP